MDVPVPLLAAPVSPKKNNSNGTRRSANYHPSIWGNYFLAYDSNLKRVDTRDEQELEQLKEEVKKMLLLAPEKSLQKINLIDKIQRLGVAYHFEEEIEASLNRINDAYQECFIEDGDDIYSVALRFRLLRQQGYRVSCDVFNKFKDPKGGFNESLINSVAGVLNLYEASHYRVHGEDILEEALAFTTTHLESVLPTLTPSLATQTIQTLKLPIQKYLSRHGAKEYIFIYEKDAAHDELLLKFAKLDFNILQKIHQRELSGITMWWKSLEFEKKLPFARNRLVECYFWILGIYFEPQYCLGRRILTKVISLTSVIDDIYDVYGTIDELEMFTDAIERWDATSINELPSYMQLCYRALLDAYDEIEKELPKKDILHFAKDGSEQERGDVASAVECYMNQYGASKEEAYVEFQKQVTNAWKDINSECLRPTAVPIPLLQRIINYTRVINLMYKDGDEYTHSKTKLKKFISSVLVEPVII